MSINYNFKSLRVVVTGGTRGIGFTIAKKFQKSGAKVIVTGRQNKLNVLGGCEYKNVDFLDLRKLNSFRKWLEKFKPDILINNAGINSIATHDQVSINEFNRLQEINVHIPFQLCQSVLPGMKEKGWGRIINISSIWGSYSKSGRCAYTTSKFALNGLTKNLAIELAPHNILVNAVAPGFIDTTLTRSTLTPHEMAEIASSIPLGRLGHPQEIASLVAWLSSKENTYLTGQVIAVDGGYTCT